MALYPKKTKKKKRGGKKKPVSSNKKGFSSKEKLTPGSNTGKPVNKN